MRAALMILCATLVSCRGSTAPKFDGTVRKESDGSFSAYMIPPYKSNHASTIEELPDGTLVAAWFSGEKEEASGCAIVFATLPANSPQWSKATTVSKRDKYSNQNPVLFWDTTSRILHLFHSQAPAESGESASEIWHLQSLDDGRTWTPPAPYFTQPGAFPRNRIIRTLSGGLLFPIYNASSAPAFGGHNYAIMARTDANLSTWILSPVNGSANLVQPTVVREQADTSKLRVFFRDRRASRIYQSMSTDDGVTWDPPSKTSLPNNNAGIEANVLSDGSFVLVFNPTTKDRNPIAIAISADDGESWPHQRNLQDGNSVGVSSAGSADDSGLEFSYPTVLQTADGNIHVMYTYDRDTIKYKRVTPNWIKSKE